MEAIPTFALPNQFLIYVAGKVLVHYDLNLVLTEYYKERLNSQLKNRETYTNEDNSTESTELLLPTHLPILIRFHLQSPQQRGHLFPFLYFLFLLCLFLLSRPN